MLRQGIAALIADELDMTVVGEAANGREAIQQFRAHHPDVTLMDLQMPEMNGLDAMMRSAENSPTRELSCSPPTPATSRPARYPGGCPRIFKNSLHKELLDTIRAVHGEKEPFPEVSFELPEHLRKRRCPRWRCASCA